MAESARAQNWNDFHFTRLFGDVTLRIELSDEERSTLATDLSQEELLTREILSLGSVGYYYHPKLIEFDLNGSLGFQQQKIFADEGLSDQTTSTFFPNWDLRARLFKDHAYPAELYSFRSETWTRQSFFPTVRTNVTESGFNLLAKDLLVPSRLHYHHYTFDSDGASAQDQIRDNVTLTGAKQEGEHQFNYGLEYNKVSQDRSSLSYEDYSADARSTLFLGKEDGLRWTNFVRARSQVGNTDVDSMTGSSQLYKRWNSNLNGNAGVQYNRTESGTIFNETTSLSLGLGHQLYESLASSATVQVGQTRLEDGEIGSYGIGGGLAYQKKTPFGRLGLRYELDFYVQDQDDLQGIAPVFDESHVYTPGIPLILGNHAIDPLSVLITDAAGLIIYVEGSDYFLAPVGSLLRVDIPVGSLINAGDTLLIDYVFAPTPAIKFGSLAQTTAVSFDFGQRADFMVSYSEVEQDLRGGVDTGVLTDSQRTSASFNVHPFDATLGVQYEDYVSDFAPFERTTVLASYQLPIRRRSLLRLNANTFSTQFDGLAERERGRNASVSLVSGAGKSALFQITGNWHRIENVSDEGEGIGFEAAWKYQFRALKLSLNLRYTDEEFVVASDQRILALFFTITRIF